MTYREAIAAALDDELEADPAVLLMGEDVGAPGGVFKTNEGLVERFGPDTRRSTRRSARTASSASPWAWPSPDLRPVVEIMFSDFLPTAGDAIVNELPKFRFMSGGQCTVPLTVRAIGGGTGRFGTQHSATGESWYMQLPGLKVATAGYAGAGLRRAARRHPRATTRCCSSSTRAADGARARSSAVPPRAARWAGPAVLRAGSRHHVVATMLMARSRAHGRRGAGRRGHRRRGDRPALAAPARHRDRATRASSGPAGCSSSRSRSTPPAGERR